MRLASRLVSHTVQNSLRMSCAPKHVSSSGRFQRRQRLICNPVSSAAVRADQHLTITGQTASPAVCKTDRLSFAVEVIFQYQTCSDCCQRIYRSNNKFIQNYNITLPLKKKKQI